MVEAGSKSVKVNPRNILVGVTLFFPVATIYAIFVLPISVFSLIGITSVFSGLFSNFVSASEHAHEMLFGFALAVVAGNQLGTVAGKRLAALIALWIASRVAFLLFPQSAAAAAANIAFAALLAFHLTPRLFGAAKKWRNQALPAVLTAICASGIAFQLAHYTAHPLVEHTILRVTVLLFTLLLLFMGGRILAPAAAGQFYRQDNRLDTRVQPRIESGLILSMAVAATATAFVGMPGSTTVGAIAMLTAGLLAAARLVRWRLWVLRARPDLLCLGAGYAWLALGLLAFGVATITGRYQTAALHTITVGGLGTLTLNVMAMMWLQRGRLDRSRARLPVWGTLLIALATVARVFAGLGAYDPRPLLVLASICWSGAFGLLLVLFIRVGARPRRSSDHDH